MDRFTKPQLIEILFEKDRYPVCAHLVTGEKIPFWDLETNQWNLITSIPEMDRVRVMDRVHNQNYDFNEYERLCLLKTGWLLFKEEDYDDGRWDEWKFEIKE